jgi:hypothetical protein
MPRLIVRVSCGGILVSGLIAASTVRADGGFFWGEASSLAQTRQEALMAIHGDEVTYVIRSLYDGSPNEFAWVLPLPNTPGEVIAHPNDALFEDLDAHTRPTFASYFGGGPTCCCAMAAGGGPVGDLTQVEASGQAGVYDWAALTSTGAGSLMDWLTTNGYQVRDSAAYVLQGYILQDMHFLAIRVREGEAQALSSVKGIPPIQFTVQTTKRFYPMVISSVSAAPETEVVLYVLATHRAKASNLPNVQIDAASLVVDYSGPSGTNYERLFTQKIDDLGGLALITEYASPGVAFLKGSTWPQAPAGLWDQAAFLTRMRTVISPDRMAQDFEFDDATSDTELIPHYEIDMGKSAGSAAALAIPVGGLLMFGWFCRAVRESRRRHRCRSVAPEDLIRSTGML